jgi:RNA-binding protein
MDIQELRKQAHDLDVTVWVGSGGVDAVVDELAGQLEARELVKVKFLSARDPDTSTEDLADALAERVGATLVETRGHTAVFH